MTDIIATPILGYAAATGITLLGVATGLDPALMGAGACGGWWALSLADKPMTVGVRLNSVMISSVIASYGAPVAAAELVQHEWVAEVAARGWTYVLAMTIGLLAMPVLGIVAMDLGRAAGQWVKRLIDRSAS